jgi:hypothetical protein
LSGDNVLVLFIYEFLPAQRVGFRCEQLNIVCFVLGMPSLSGVSKQYSSGDMLKIESFDLMHHVVQVFKPWLSLELSVDQRQRVCPSVTPIVCVCSIC